MLLVFLDLAERVDGLLVEVEEVTILFKVLVVVLVVHGAAVHYCQEVHMLVVDLVVLLVSQREQMVSLEREVVVVLQRSLEIVEVVLRVVRVLL
jgi:hypothetical protein